MILIGIPPRLHHSSQNKNSLRYSSASPFLSSEWKVSEEFHHAAIPLREMESSAEFLRASIPFRIMESHLRNSSAPSIIAFNNNSTTTNTTIVILLALLIRRPSLNTLTIYWIRRSLMIVVNALFPACIFFSKFLLLYLNYFSFGAERTKKLKIFLQLLLKENSDDIPVSYLRDSRIRPKPHPSRYYWTNCPSENETINSATLLYSMYSIISSNALAPFGKLRTSISSWILNLNHKILPQLSFSSVIIKSSIYYKI